MVDLPRNNLEYGKQEQRIGYAVADAIDDLFGAGGTGGPVQVTDFELQHWTATVNDSDGSDYNANDLLREEVQEDGTSVWRNLTQGTVIGTPPIGEISFGGGSMSGNPLEDGRVAVILPSDKSFKVTPTVDTAAYAKDDVLVTGGIEITNANFAAGRSVRINDVTLVDESSNGDSIDILFLDAAPTGTYTQNTPFALDAADAPKVVTNMRVDDFTDFNGATVTTVEVNKILVPAASGTSLWMLLVARKNMTFTNADDLHIHVGLDVE